MRACVRACVRAYDSAHAHSILYALYAIVRALPRFRREGSLEYLNLRVCACVRACIVCVRKCAIAPTNEVAEVSDEAEMRSLRADLL